MDLATPLDLPPGWAVTTLGDLLEVLRGVTYDKQNAVGEARDGFVPILRATNITSSLTFTDLVYVPERYVSAAQLLQKHDIIVAASSGSASVVGKTALLLEDWHGSFGAFCFALRSSPQVDAKFLSFFTHTTEYRNQVTALAAGVNINNLRRHHIEEISVCLPPLPEQRRIVGEIERQFSLLDAGVANLKRVQANLKRYRTSVLQAACEGRLVPTEAELARAEGRDYEPAAVLLSRILAERRARWVAEQTAKKGQSKAGKSDPFRVKEVLNPQTAVHFQDLEDNASLLNSAFSIDEVDSTAGVHLTFNERASAYDASSDSESSVVDPLFRNQEVDALESPPLRLFSRQFRYDQSSTVFKGYKEPAAPDTSALPPLPEGWTWCAAAQVCGFITKGTTPASDKMQGGSGDVPYIKVYNLTHDGRLDFSVNPTFIGKKTHETELARSRVIPGDVLMNIVGPPLGKVSTVPDVFPEWNINQAIAIFRPLPGKDRKFLAFSLLTENILSRITSKAKATAGQYNLTLEQCRMLPLPLPPLAEQERIVAEVERRLSVVDNLEQVVKANLKRADRLRQSILKEAFAGGLVPQDPADEPADALLERVTAGREAQAKAAVRPTKARPRKENSDAKPRSNDTTGARVPSGDDQRQRDPAAGAWLQPVLFSTGGE